MAFITAETRSDIIALVVTMLDRAPDDALLNELVTASTSGKTLDEIADMIAMTDEFTEANPASQTAEEYATAALDRVFEGTGVSAATKADAVDLAVSFLNDGMTKAGLAREINKFLSQPSVLLDANYGDVAQTFVNKNTVAEYYVLDADLGDLTTAELTAALASVTAEADSVTAATDAADATAAAEDVVAGQTFTLTTGVEEVTGTVADETFNALAENATTGAAATTISSGDVIDGGAGTDTLNITMTATNNNSLAGVTVKNVENVYVTGANFQTSGETGAALTAATAAKAATAASLAAAQAAVVTATKQGAAADAVTTLATSVAQDADVLAGDRVDGYEGEDGVLQAASATVASAASNAAAAAHIAALSAAGVAEASAADATVPEGATAFTAAQMQAAAKAALLTAAGGALDSGDADDAKAIVDRAEVLENTAEKVKTAVDATQQDQATAIQLKAAADAVDALTTEAAVVAASTGDLPDGVTTYTKAQYNAAALASLKADTGVTLITDGDDSDAITARAEALAGEAGALVSYGSGNFTLAQLNTAAAAALTSATGVSLQTNGDDSTAIQGRAEKLDTVLITDPDGVAAGADEVLDTNLASGTITAANTAAAKAVVADNTAASALAVATAAAAAVADASLSGASFVGSEQVWLKGADSNKTDLTVTTQTAGLSGVTGLDNKITFGTTGALAVAGSKGTVDIGGAAGGLTLAGTGGSLTLTNTGGTTEAKAVKALTISTSGAMAADVAGLAQLTTVTSNGEGGATVSGSGAKLATIVTGEGSDSVKIGTTTVKDNTTTAKDETINADVSTGAGNDTVNIGTTGAGTTTVATGAGNDTLYVQGISTGAGTVTTGEGNDTVNLNVTLAANPSMTIAAGDGVDSLITAGGTLGAVDYLRMNTALSGFETVTFTGDTTVDVSELAIGSIAALTFANSGASTVTEVGATALVLAPLAAAKASTNGIVPARALELGGKDLTASAAGYKAATDATAAVYGGPLNITSAGFLASEIEANATTATITVSSIGGETAATSNAEAVTLVTSDIEGLVVNLSSARGTAAATAATEFQSTFDAGTIVNTADNINEHLEALSSIEVNGSGVFKINTGTVAKDIANLTTIDVSGMVAFADLDATGVQASTANKSTTAITLNANVSETVILGGGDDKVITNSTVAAPDTITGFELTPTVASALVGDANRSDEIDVTGDQTFVKFVSSTATTLAGILTEAGAAVDANDDATDNLVFQFGGDTYVYQDIDVAGDGTAGLSDDDVLIKLTGTLDLDQLISVVG
jgi:hypothetical protein